ncbi:MAG: ribonuclease HII [Rhizobiales bacterium]|nr:ribonuclease HII [Hyphomicrobiales bacterium]
MLFPSFDRETELAMDGTIVCGVDEAGRGPWAGPVVAAAVILSPRNIPPGLNDSKKLTEAKREALYGPIMQGAIVGVGIISAARIDQINILQATYEAMREAVQSLATTPHLALIDGNRAPPLSCRCETIVEGDAKSLSIAAASIIAKVTRDRLMHDLDRQYPDYGFAAHKGYGTEGHQAALSRHGPCSEHRRSFAPIRLLLGC